jgi:serine protease inhibitor
MTYQSYSSINSKSIDSSLDDILKEYNTKYNTKYNSKYNSKKKLNSIVNFDKSQHKFNIKRRMMERNGLFNINSRSNDTNNTNIDDMSSNYSDNSNLSDNSNYSNYSDNSNLSDNSNYSDNNYNRNKKRNVGEITGERFNAKNIDQGMPMRSINERHGRKSDELNKVHDNINNDPINKHLDFDLYSSKPHINVSYYDPKEINPSLGFTGFAELNSHDQKISQESKFSSTINQFTIDMLQQFKSALPKNKSLFISPYNILQSFIMLYRGSKNKTESELKKVFMFSDKTTTFTTFNKIVQDVDRTQSMFRANAIFFAEKHQINQGYVNYVKNLGVIDTFNPSKHIDETNRINYMVQNMSKGTITNLLDPKIINNNSKIVLVSTIYFYSKWKQPFSEFLTELRPFYSTALRHIPSMVQQDVIHNYFEDNNYQIIEMDYNDNKLCMGFILPKTKSGINMKIQNGQLEYYISQMSKKKINTVQIPKFKQQSKFKIDNMFKKMGLKELCTRADLSEITPSEQSYYLSDIIHQAFVVVNENGNNKINNTTNTDTNTNTIVINAFIANKPFIYYIRYKPYNTILFIGNYF